MGFDRVPNTNQAVLGVPCKPLQGPCCQDYLAMHREVVRARRLLPPGWAELVTDGEKERGGSRSFTNQEQFLELPFPDTPCMAYG